MEDKNVQLNLIDDKYSKSVNRMGAIFCYTALILFILVPVAMSIHFDAYPTFMDVFKPLMTIFPLYFVVQVIEIATYVPMFGDGASYLCFVTGNLSNLKAPAIMNALEATKAENGTVEREVVSTIAVATSAIVTTVILAVGVMLFMLIPPLQTALVSPTLAPAFDNLLAALFGAMGVVFVSKNPKISIAPIVLALTLFFTLGTATYTSIVSILVPVIAIVTILVSRLLYKKGII